MGFFNHKNGLDPNARIPWKKLFYLINQNKFDYESVPVNRIHGGTINIVLFSPINSGLKSSFSNLRKK